MSHNFPGKVRSSKSPQPSPAPAPASAPAPVPAPAAINAAYTPQPYAQPYAVPSPPPPPPQYVAPAQHYQPPPQYYQPTQQHHGAAPHPLHAPAPSGASHAPSPPVYAISPHAAPAPGATAQYTYVQIEDRPPEQALGTGSSKSGKPSKPTSESNTAPLLLDADPTSNSSEIPEDVKDMDHGYICGRKIFSSKYDKPRAMTPAEKVLTAIQCLIAAVTLIISIVAYFKWDTSSSMFNDIRQNWRGYPIDTIRPAVRPANSLHPPSCNSGEVAFGLKAYYTWWDEDSDRRRTLKRITVDQWRGALFCATLRADMGNAVTRVRPDRFGNCPSGYTKCTPNDCSPTTKCPVTSIEFSSTSQGGGPDEVYWVQPWSNSPTYMTLRRSGSRPLIDGGLSDTSEMCLGSNPYTPNTMNTGAGCSVGKDNRFTVADLYPLRDFLQEHAAPQSAIAASGNKIVHLFQRGEIAWNDRTCPYSRDDVVDHIPTLLAVSTAQQIMMIIIVISTLINIFLYYRLWRLRSPKYAPRDGDKADKAAYRQFVLGTVVDAVVVVITIYALVKSEMVAHFVHDISQTQADACTDASTKWVFDNFVEGTDRLTTFNLSILIMKGVWVIYRLFKWFKYGEAVV